MEQRFDTELIKLEESNVQKLRGRRCQEITGMQWNECKQEFFSTLAMMYRFNEAKNCWSGICTLTHLQVDSYFKELHLAWILKLWCELCEQDSYWQSFGKERLSGKTYDFRFPDRLILAAPFAEPQLVKGILISYGWRVPNFLDSLCGS